MLTLALPALAQSAAVSATPEKAAPVRATPVAQPATAKPARAAPPQAAVLFAERTALLAIDSRCRLLSEGARAALAAGAVQARGVLSRQGWAPQRLNDIAFRAGRESQSRACTDPAALEAAAAARKGFAAWSRMHAITFPGDHAAWSARRTADPNQGWVLWQDLPQAEGARIGLRKPDFDKAATLVLSLPKDGRPAPAQVQLLARDPARLPTAVMDVPGRVALSGPANGAAPTGASRVWLPQARLQTPGLRAEFQFPTSALAAIADLDPRESAVVELSDSAGRVERLFIEAGDLAAARAFLLAEPDKKP
jgi:hypothetical protein